MQTITESIAQAGTETVSELTELAKNHNCEFLKKRISWAEESLVSIYKRAVLASKQLDEPREIAAMWKEVEATCTDVLTVFSRACGQQPDCPTELGKIFEIKMACHEQEEFHQCC